MKFLIKTTLLSLFLGIVTLYGETVIAGSNIFTFPEMTGIKTIPYAPKPSLFTVQRTGHFSRAVTFSWSFPSKAANREGVITIYSLLGKVVTRIPVQTSSGSTRWDFSRSFNNSGLYIARISYGAESKNLKLMLWN